MRVETLETRDVFAAGDLDTSFGTSGIARIENDPSSVETFRVGGNLYVANGSSAVTKLTGQGALVTGYGNAGQASILHETAAVQSSGAVVTAGTEFGAVSLDAFFRRTAANGDPDTNFGTSGSTVIDFLPTLTAAGTDPTVYDYLADLEIDGADRTWALIRGDVSNSAQFLSFHFAGIARLTTDGQLDAAFGASGLAAIEVPTTDGFQATDLQLTSDGGAVIAGVYTTGGVSTAALYKINSSGALVASFGTAGRAMLGQFGLASSFNNVELTLDPATGGFYVAAYRDLENGTYDLRLTKVTSTGATATFGTGGVVELGNVENNFTVGNDGFALAAQSDGKPIVVYGGPDWNVARFTTTGAVDAAFGTNGVVQTSLGSESGAYANPQSVLVQSDGMIVVSGKYSPGGAAAVQTVLARYFSVDANGAPESEIDSIDATTYQNNLQISWSGVSSPGSTITGYDIYYQVQGEAPVLWQNNTSATTAVFTVATARHKSVGFYSIARDNLGRVEAAPSGGADATTVYIGAPWQNPVDRFDVLTGGTDTGQIDPGDILYVITEYTNNEISNPATKEVILPPTKTYTNGRWVDVDGDNLISPADILFVVVRYQELQAQGEGETIAASVLPSPLPLSMWQGFDGVEADKQVDDSTDAAPAAGSGTDDDLLAQLAAALLAAEDDEDE